MYRLIVCVTIFLPLFLSCQAQLDFTPLTGAAAWSPRHHALVYAVPDTLNYSLNSTIITANTGSLILFGGCNDAFDTTALSDQWLSTDYGNSWIVLPFDNRTLEIKTFSSMCVNIHQNVIYVIPQDPSGFSTLNFSLWTITNQTSSTSVVTEPRVIFQHRYGSNCWVDTRSQVHYLFGINSTAASIGTFDPYNDAWLSNDTGISWTPQSAQLPWPPRYNSKIGVQLNNSAMLVDLVYVLGGQTGNQTTWSTLPDDLWVSSDEGSSWKQVSGSLPWNPVSSSYTGEAFAAEAFYVDASGLLIISVNGEWIGSDSTPNSRSDIWISFDGGWNWNLCLQNASYGSRRDPTLFADTSGRLYLLGGFIYKSDYVSYNDIWIASMSLSDPKALARSCGTSLPPCGVGLQNWNGPCVDSSDTTSLAEIVVPAVVVPLVVLVIGCLVIYLYRKDRCRRRATLGDQLYERHEGPLAEMQAYQQELNA